MATTSPRSAYFPLAPSLLALSDHKLDVDGDPEAIRHAVVEHFATQGGAWDLSVQLCTDLEKMPVEDASVAWDEQAQPLRARGASRDPVAGRLERAAAGGDRRSHGLQSLALPGGASASRIGDAGAPGGLCRVVGLPPVQSGDARWRTECAHEDVDQTSLSRGGILALALAWGPGVGRMPAWPATCCSTWSS